MTEEANDRSAVFTQTIDRFSKLNEEGRRYFTGRLVESAKDNPALMREIEHVMQRLETESDLAICWKAAAGAPLEVPAGPQAEA